ncbi:MAG: hypothetical protein WBG80_15275 [Bacteroidota bacterium]
MKRALGVVGIFILCWAGAPGQQTWFEDGFQRDSLGADLIPISGNWTIGKGTLAITTGEFDQLLATSFYAYDSSPYAIEARLRGSRAGLLFCMDDRSTHALSHMVRFEGKNILTGYFDVTGEFITTNLFDSPVSPEEWTTLRVEVDPPAGTYEVRVNDVPAGRNTMLVFPSGYVGLQASTGTSEFTRLQVTGTGSKSTPRRPRSRSQASFQHVAFVRAGQGNVTIYNPDLEMYQALDLQGRILALDPARRPPPADTRRRAHNLTYEIEGTLVLITDRTSGRVDTVRDQLVSPASLVVERDSSFFVADPGARAVHHFSREGAHLESFTGSSFGGLLAPRGIDLFGSEEIVIADYNRLLFVKRSLADALPEIRIRGPREISVSWNRTQNESPSVDYARDGRDWKTIRGSVSENRMRNTVRLSGLRPLTRYTLRAHPTLKSIPPTSAQPVERRVSTPPARAGMMAYNRLPVLCMVYRTISYRDVFPESDYPGVPGGRTLSDAELDYLQKGVLFNEEFAFRNSSCKLFLDFDFYVVEDTLWLSNLGDKDPYWLPPNRRVARDFKIAAIAMGKSPEEYAGLVVPYAWLNHPSRRKSALSDTSKEEGISIRQTYGGGTYGVPAPWEFSSVGYSGNPFQDKFSRQDWLMLHEFHHQLGALLEASGHPEYHHADRPWEMPGRFGEDFDFNAQIIRNAAHEWWDHLRFGSYEEAADGDQDGVPDDAPELPFDEIRLGGSPLETDTDGDGLADLAEVVAGTSRGTDLTLVDTDGDGLADGIDPEPLYPFAPVFRRISGGDLTADHAFGSIRAEGLTAEFRCGWDSSALTVSCEASSPVNLLLQIDAEADGWFHGFDNLQIRVAFEGDSVTVLDYYLRDCSSRTGVPKDRKDILRISDLGLETRTVVDTIGVTPDPQVSDTTAPEVSTRYEITLRVPPLDEYGLSMSEGKEFAVRLGVQTATDRWVWHELFERNYMMVVGLK